MGAGRGGGAGGVSPVSRSHRAQGGLCGRPANAWGSVARLRLGLRGGAGMGGGGALRRGQLRGNMTESQRRANKASWEYNRCDHMALPPPKRVELGHFTRFWGRNNYPQWSGTRPSEAGEATSHPLSPPSFPWLDHDRPLWMARRVEVLPDQVDGEIVYVTP